MNDQTALAPLISVVSPVYLAAGIVEELVRRINAALLPLAEEFEIVLVEDGSPDESWARIRACAAADRRVKGLRLSRNFGQHHAIAAGLARARGRYVVVMDCDLQDDPKYIPALLEEARKGFDIVYTRKPCRRHSAWKNLWAGAYHRVFSWLSEGVESRGDIGAFSMISRRVARAYGALHDAHRHYLLVLRWLGFPSTCVEIEHLPRFQGKSSYSFGKLVSHAINGITSHSTRLLGAAVILGLALCLLSAAAVLLLVFLYFLHGFKEGWTSVAVLILFSTGSILLCLGVMGIYVGKTFEQAKNRPFYLEAEALNFEEGISAQHTALP